MSLPQLVRRYASALFEVAVETESIEEVRTDMDVLAKIFRDLPEVLNWCRNGRAHGASAETFVSTAFLPYVGDLTARTVKMAADYGRLSVLPLLPAAIQILSDRAAATVPAVLETVQEPDLELIEEVKTFLSQRTGKQPSLSWRIRPELKGGVRILWNDSVIDLSARERLRRMRTLLTSP